MANFAESETEIVHEDVWVRENSWKKNLRSSTSHLYAKCKLAVLPGAQLHKLALHYSRVADPSHPGTCFSGLSVARALSADPCATSPRDRRWLVSATSDVAAAAVISAGPPSPSSLASLLPQSSLAFSLFFFILSLVSPLPSVFSLVPSVVFRWTFV